jgi:hypothetical protein
MPLLVILSGILGGLILTIAVIMIVILCRKNISSLKKKSGSDHPKTTTPSDMLTIKPMTSRPSHSGSDEDEAIIVAMNKAPSSTSTSTSADGMSNNSSELKDRMPEEYWESDRYRASAAANVPAAVDYVDSATAAANAAAAGLPTPFEHQSYNQYYNNLVQASNDYFGVSSGNGGNNKSAENLEMYNRHHRQQQQLQHHGLDSTGRYSVHVRESPISPAHSGISVKTGYSMQPSAAGGNTSYDYMPASAFLGAPPLPGAANSATMPRNLGGYRGGYPSSADNYSVYVNGHHHKSNNGGYSGHHHEVVVPVHEGSTGSSSKASSSTASTTANGSSLATHV